MRARVWGKAWVHLAAGEAALWRSGPRHTATEGSFSATPAEYLRASNARLLALFYKMRGLHDLKSPSPKLTNMPYAKQDDVVSL